MWSNYLKFREEFRNNNFGALSVEMAKSMLCVLKIYAIGKKKQKKNVIDDIKQDKFMWKIKLM